MPEALEVRNRIKSIPHIYIKINVIRYFVTIILEIKIFKNIGLAILFLE